MAPAGCNNGKLPQILSHELLSTTQRALTVTDVFAARPSEQIGPGSFEKPPGPISKGLPPKRY